MMTMQQVFDKVKAHLLRQGEKSTNFKGECMYRGREGRMCAVGCLIADEHYTFTLENQTPYCGDVKRALEKSGVLVDRDMERFLGRLQSTHDSTPPDKWEEALGWLEKTYLKAPAEGS